MRWMPLSSLQWRCRPAPYRPARLGFATVAGSFAVLAGAPGPQNASASCWFRSMHHARKRL